MQCGKKKPFVELTRKDVFDVEFVDYGGKISHEHIVASDFDEALEIARSCRGDVESVAGCSREFSVMAPKERKSS
jgi:hypothetical protein